MAAREKISRILRTVRMLGLSSVARLAIYKVQLRLGLFERLRAPLVDDRTPLFRAPEQQMSSVTGTHSFDHFGKPVAQPAGDGWHTNPITGEHFAFDHMAWPIALRNLPETQDIKDVWELSRFYWAPRLASSAALANNQTAIGELNALLDDWLGSNPPWQGLNWACGQESAIRLLHVAAAALILEQAAQPEPALVQFAELTEKRVAATIGYALSQQNNHAITELAGLFIARSIIGKDTDSIRRRLEEIVQEWIAEDGGWTQYSPNYHRVVVDALWFLELWRSRLDLIPFSDAFYRKAQAAVSWLAQMVEPETGQTPNIGANDSTRLFSMQGEDPRDYRGTLAMGAAVFDVSIAPLSHGPWEERLRAFGMKAPMIDKNPLSSQSFLKTGLHVLRAGAATAYLKFPRSDYRPPQADALHCDLWLGRENILQDSGSYRYTSSDDANAVFAGTAAHNTVSFDDCDQMPRLSRFLFADWLESEEVEAVETRAGSVRASASYHNRIGHHHRRVIELTATSMTCTDYLSGQYGAAALFWHLEPEKWHVGNSGKLVSESAVLAVTANGKPLRPQLEQTSASPIYRRLVPQTRAKYVVGDASPVTTHLIFS